MPVPTLITELSQTAASNSPAGTESPITADNYFRAISGFVAELRDGVGFAAPVTLASAATTSIGAQNSLAVEITGTTTITSFGTTYKGPRLLRFTGALTLTHSSSLNLPGAANITTVAGDTCIAEPNSAGNGWNVYAYQRSASLPAPIASPTFTGIVTTAGQIKFPATQSASADVNTLDDYEEAAGASGWTPADGSGAGLSLIGVSAQYVKIGCMVFVQASLSYPVTANSSSAQITGLPFQVRSGVATGSLTVGRIQGGLDVQAYIGGSAGSEVIYFVKPATGTPVLNSDLSGFGVNFSGWYISS